MTNYTTNLNELQGLTANQLELAREAAIARVKRIAGDKPTRDQFRREYAPIWDIQLKAGALLFLMLFLISGLHIWQYMTDYAMQTYQPVEGAAGLTIPVHMWAFVHQFGGVFISELGIIFFMVWHNKRTHLRASRKWYLRPLSPFILLAIAAAAMVLIANLSNGENSFVAIIPPLFTMGLSIPLETAIVESDKRKAEIDSRYVEALDKWQKAAHNPEDHPEYQGFLYRAVWEKLISYKANAAYADADRAFKMAAVRRELDKDNWTDAGEHPPAAFFRSETHTSDGPAVITVATERPTNGYRREVYLRGESS